MIQKINEPEFKLHEVVWIHKHVSIGEKFLGVVDRLFKGPNLNWLYDIDMLFYVVKNVPENHLEKTNNE